jgi:FimV-like protein
MSEKESTWTGLWHELQRRHVVRVTLGYAAVAFVVLQMGEIILPAFTDDPVLMQVLVVVAALLFPVVIVLAWVYEVTPQGIRRMAEIDDETGHVGNLMPVFPRLVLLLVTLVVVGATGWWAVNTGLQGTRSQEVAGADPFSVQPALSSYDPDEPIRSLAVLALENFSEEGGQDFFTASLHEAIVAHLSQLPAMRVVSRTSVMRYVGTTASLPQIGAELNVDAVVEGSVTRVGDQVRVTVSLIHAGSETKIWTQQYDRTIDNILALQAEISEAIATAIQGELLPDERQTLLAVRNLSDDMEANQAMMMGRTAAEGGTQSDLATADRYFDDVIAIDSSFAPAYAEQARIQLELGMLAGDTAAFLAYLPRAVQLVEQAIALDSESPQVQAVWHFVKDLAEGGTPEVAAVSVSMSGTEMGRRLETRFGEWALRSDWGGVPRTATVTVHAAEHMAQEGQTDEALALMKRLRMKAPGFEEAWKATERILAGDERFDDIVALRLERSEVLSEDVAAVDVLQAGVDGGGAEGYWEWKFEELSDLEESGESVSHVDFAIAYLQMGDEDGALEHLEEAARRGDQRLLRERNNPAFDPLRPEPRFRSLMAGLNRRISPRGSRRRSGPVGADKSGNRHF